VYRDDNGNIYTTLDTKTTAKCPACSHTGADTRCATHSECEGWFHIRCYSPDTHSCAICSPPEGTTPDATIVPLNIEELHLLYTAPGTIFTNTDGSVKKAQTLEASLTWALSIRISPTITISRSGKISLSPGEESSYRVELEGLVQLNAILPADVTTRHACDNEAAVTAHKSIHYHAWKPARKWAKTEYRTTLDRLHQAMQSRNGDIIDVVHTHSHLEHIPTDAYLNRRRQILEEADDQANLAHSLKPTTCFNFV
jgi:hypothetical protein